MKQAHWFVKLVLAAAVAASCASTAFADVPYSSESWDIENPLGLNPYPGDPPANGENLWAYWDESYVPKDANESWCHPNYHSRPMEWSATGGVGGSGYVWAPLAELNTEHNELNAFWPAHLYDSIYTYYDHYYPQEVDYRALDLTSPANAHIRVSLLDREDVAGPGPTPNPVDLDGGKVWFFVGHWWDQGTADPNDDAWAFFYNKNGDFKIDINPSGDNTWLTTTVPVGVGTAAADDWGIIAISVDSNTSQAPPESGDEAFEHFYDPQQWGFVIYDPAGTIKPTLAGELGFDNFAIVPEPGSAILLLFGACWLRRRPKAKA